MISFIIIVVLHIDIDIFIMICRFGSKKEEDKMTGYLNFLKVSYVCMYVCMYDMYHIYICVCVNVYLFTYFCF